MESVSGGDATIIVADSIDYSEQFAQLIERTNEVTEFQYVLIQRFDFLVAVLIAIVISAVVYSIIKAFTRF